MEAEGLVAAVRTEQVGRRPARTVYAITSEGQLELAMQREQALRSIHWWPDPLGVALSFAVAGTDREELASWLRTRRETFALTAAQLAEDRERMVAKGYLDPFQATVMYRGQLHAEAEIRWHDEFAKILAGLPPEEDGGGQAPALPGANMEGTPHSDGDHRVARARPHVHQPQAHRGGRARRRPDRRRRRDRRLPRAQRGRQDHHLADAHHAAAADHGHRHGGGRRPARRSGRGAPQDRLRPPGDRRHGWRLRPELRRSARSSRCRPRLYRKSAAEAARRTALLTSQLDLAGLERPAGARRSRAASAAGSTSRSAWCTHRG